MAKYTSVDSLFNSLRIARKNIMAEMDDAVRDTLNEFKTTLVTYHMQKRGESSLGIRKGTLVRHLTTTVTQPSKGAIVGRVFFKSKKRDMIANVHQEGATIKAKPGKLLVFKVWRKYSRGNWPPQWGTSRVIAAKKVVIPKGRFPFRETWDRMLPRANKMIDVRLDKAIKDFG